MSEVQLNYATSSGAPSDVIDVEAEGSTRDLKKKFRFTYLKDKMYFKL
jgi:hypothetical protein